MSFRTKQKDEMDGRLSPADHIKHDLVKLRSDATLHYEKSYNHPKEMFAFANSVRVFAISLEPYTDKQIINETMEHYKEMEEEINKIKQSKLDIKNRELNIIKTKFDYSEPVFHQSLRIFHNSPMIELEATGILKMRDKDIKQRIRQTGETDINIEEDEEDETLIS